MLGRTGGEVGGSGKGGAGEEAETFAWPGGRMHGRVAG